MRWPVEATLSGTRRRTGGRAHHTRTPPSSSFNGVCSILGIMCFNSAGAAYRRTMGCQGRLSSSPNPRAPSNSPIPAGRPIANSSRYCPSHLWWRLVLWVAQHIGPCESRGNGFFLQFPYLYRFGYLGRGPQSVIWGNRPYWLVIYVY